MGNRVQLDDVTFEAKVEATTSKAVLVVPTMGPEQVWLPRSQIVSMGEADMDGNRIFVVTGWIAEKNGLKDVLDG